MSRYAESHKRENLAGAGDARPTALQIVEDEGLIGKLNDKVILITGVSSGIGVETLRALHATGAHVFGTVRNLQKGQAVVDKILGERREGGGSIDLIEMELASFVSVRKAATEFLARSGGKLNVLIANAGIMAVPFSLSPDGFEMQFATNHLGHFLLFQLLKDALLNSATIQFPSRYVSVSSKGHGFGPVRFHDYNFEKDEGQYDSWVGFEEKKGKYDTWAAYGQSKTANIWLANSIERHHGSQNLHATSLHPGGISESGLTAHIDSAVLQSFLTPEDLRYYKSAEQGAATQVYAAVGAEWAHKGGKYLSDCIEETSFVERKNKGISDRHNDGYATWAYDAESEERLWRESFGLVKLELPEE